MAYVSLIDQPTPSSSILSQITNKKDASEMHIPCCTMPKPATRNDANSQFPYFQKSISYKTRILEPDTGFDNKSEDDSTNEWAIPSKTTKPKLVDKPRHVRKFPLKLPNSTASQHSQLKNLSNMQTVQPIIYQNSACVFKNQESARDRLQLPNVEVKSIDILDAPELSKVNTNPFKNLKVQPSSGHPFNFYLEALPDDGEYDPRVEENQCAEGVQYCQEGSLVKDCIEHVSVEDLLEFADQKPCGRQRGVESDEVRIMCKVFKQQDLLTSDCLQALELSDWNVHQAIKVMRVKTSVGQASLEACHRELVHTGGDVLKAAAVLTDCKQTHKII